MVDININAKHLILEIEKHECIWNTDVEEYSNKLVKEEAWNDICRVMYANEWLAFNSDVKALRVSDLKKRWHNIRDYYKKLLERDMVAAAGDHSIVKRKKYIYAEVLHFLQPFIIGPKKCIKTSNYEESEDECTDNSSMADTSTASLIDRKEPIQTLQVFEAPIDNPVYQTSEEDPDLMFFKSLLPDMRRLTDSQKFNFKYGIMKLLAEASGYTRTSDHA